MFFHGGMFLEITIDCIKADRARMGVPENWRRLRPGITFYCHVVVFSAFEYYNHNDNWGMWYPGAPVLDRFCNRETM